jgi:DNA-binding NarL/FixJ family response regulator
LKCLVIADDSALVRKLIRKHFEANSWEVCGEACNGQEAIDLALKHNPHVVILDLSMPVMHGLEAGRILQKILPTIRLILFGLSADLLAKEDLLGAGFSAAVCKSSPHLLLGKAEELYSADLNG